VELGIFTHGKKNYALHTSIIKYSSREYLLIINIHLYLLNFNLITVFNKVKNNLHVILNFGRRAVAPQIFHPSCAYACLPPLVTASLNELK
jgi:hypothetical protein